MDARSGGMGESQGFSLWDGGGFFFVFKGDLFDVRIWRKIIETLLLGNDFEMLREMK